MNAARRVEPTRSLLQGGAYIPAALTDIRARFEAMRAGAESGTAENARTTETPAPHQSEPESQ